MARFQRSAANREVAEDDYALIRELWAAWSPGFRLSDERWVELRETLVASGSRPLDYYRAVAQFSTVKAFTTLRREEISTPVTTIFGSRDGCIDVAMAHGAGRYFSGEYALEVIEGAGHFIHLEAPTALASRIISRLQTD